MAIRLGDSGSHAMELLVQGVLYTFGASGMVIPSGGFTLTSGNLTLTAGNVVLAAGSVAQAPSATAPATATAGTIATASVGVSKSNPAGNITGVIMEAGTLDGQEVTVVNKSAFSITMATAATSNVAAGTGCVIATLTAARFVWESASARWYECK